MGQKLNCCERKDVDHQELRKEEGNQSDKLIKETEKPFVKSAHSPNQETNDQDKSSDCKNQVLNF